MRSPPWEARALRASGPPWPRPCSTGSAARSASPARRGSACRRHSQLITKRWDAKASCWQGTWSTAAWMAREQGPQAQAAAELLGAQRQRAYGCLSKPQMLASRTRKPPAGLCCRLCTPRITPQRAPNTLQWSASNTTITPRGGMPLRAPERRRWRLHRLLAQAWRQAEQRLQLGQPLWAPWQLRARAPPAARSRTRAALPPPP